MHLKIHNPPVAYFSKIFGRGCMDFEWPITGNSSLMWTNHTTLSIYLCTMSLKDVGSMNKISPSIPILSIPISLEEGAASNDIIFPSLPWSSLSVGTRDHFHKNAFGKTHVAHSANMTKMSRILLGLNLLDGILRRTSSLCILCR